MIKGLGIIAAGLMLSVGLSSAATVAYNDPAIVGNQSFTGSLGMDFNVLNATTITALGAFDSGQNGFSGPITVSIYNADTGVLVAGLSQVLTGTTGTLVGGDRFVTLTTPVTLAAGFHGRVVASGFSAADPNGNDGVPGFSGNTTTGGGLLTFVGNGFYDVSPGVFPTTADGGPANRYGAGDFQFQASATPEPTTISLFSCALAGLALLARKKKKQ